MICLLCKREIEGKKSKHHLVPVLKGGKDNEQVWLHQICHDKIHSLFTETKLAKQLNTIEKLLENEDVKSFVKWVGKLPNDYYDSSKRSKIHSPKKYW